MCVLYAEFGLSLDTEIVLRNKRQRNLYGSVAIMVLRPRHSGDFPKVRVSQWRFPLFGGPQWRFPTLAVVQWRLEMIQ